MAPPRPAEVNAVTDVRPSRPFVFPLLVLVITALAGLLRLIGLEDNPPGFWQDEASTGIDAYLLWKTGRDRAGAFLPLISRSFGDYPLALYRYLDAPLVGIFGPSVGRERLVAGLTGTLMVAITGWVVKHRFSTTAAIGAMISAALCPTWIQFSRYGSEAILMPALLVLGWGLADRAERRPWMGWWAAVALGLSAYTYHAIKVFLPFWVAAFLWLQWPLVVQLYREQRRHLVGPALLFTAIVLPSAVLAFSEGGRARGNTVLAWFHYSGFDLVRAMVGNYLSYFDPGMLFVRGGPAVSQSMPKLGMWSYLDLPLFFCGAVALFRGPIAPRLRVFLIAWFLLGPMPGGLTYETHNMGRAIGWLPVPQIVAGLGFATIVAWVKERWEGGARLRALSAAVALSATLIATSAFTAWVVYAYYPKITERDWQFEISRAMRCAKDLRREEKLVVSPAFTLADVFARFFFAELGPLDRPVWELGDRTAVAPGELYLFPAQKPAPKGEKLCEISNRQTKAPVSYVYGPPLPAGPVPDKLGR